MPQPQTEATDIWFDWLLHRRHGDSARRASDLHPELDRYANRVLEAAGLSTGLTMVDIGTGTGLIAFEAIARTGPTLNMILTDISAPLLQHARQHAEELNVGQQCRFIVCPADDLSAIPDESVDIVTTRSVLAYVADKPRALSEFYRILKPGGRLSCAEPILRDDAFKILTIKHWLADHPDHPNAAYLGLLHRWKAVQYPDTLEQISASPLTNYSERDLFAMVMNANFVHTRVELHLEASKQQPLNWEEYIECTPHPLAPPLSEILQTRFSPQERDFFEQTMRSLLAGGATDTIDRMIYLSATKPV